MAAMFQLNGKIAVVTGAARGIVGLALSHSPRLAPMSSASISRPS